MKADIEPENYMLPPFAILRAFEAVVRLGGVRKAARILGLHHSVVSRHVAQLEAWLGLPLLDRSSRRVALTEQGAQFHHRISAAIADMARATQEVMDKEARRPLRLWCAQGLATEWLARNIVEFERLYPHIHVELRPSENPADLLRYEADANIFMRVGETLEQAERGLKSRILARPLSMIAVSPDLIDKLSWIRTAQDLARAPLLHGAHTDDWREWLTIHGVDPPDNLPGELCWQSHMALEATRLGRGLGIGNRFFFARDLARGSLVELTIPGVTYKAFGGYVFTAREDRWSSPRLAAIRSFLDDRMKVLELAS